MGLNVAATAMGALGGLTLVLSLLLVVARRKLYVWEDPRIDQVEEMLPHANCGACGFPGCRPFAEALVRGNALPGKCSVGSDEERTSIAAFLGVDVGAVQVPVARLACGGGSNVARMKAHYHGAQTCRAAALAGGGGKGCNWGCLGLGDCRDVCDFKAIHLDAHSLPVVTEDLCTACGACVTVCPKSLFSLEPRSVKLWVNCKSRAEGDDVLQECEVGCTACARCAMDAPGSVVMEGNLPVVGRLTNPPRSAIERCPTGAIVWFDQGRAHKGAAAPEVIRKGTMPMGHV